MSDDAVLTVTPAELTRLELTPEGASAASGLTQQFTATGVFTDNTRQDVTAAATWSSPALSFSQTTPGLATTSAVGETEVTASFNGKTATTKFTVTAAALTRLELAPGAASVPRGLTQQFTATGFFTDGTSRDVTTETTWSSSADTVASVSNLEGSQGVAAANEVGAATLTASLNGVNGSASMTVTAAVVSSLQVDPGVANATVGTNTTFTATARYSDHSTQDVTNTVAWSTSNAEVAMISNHPGFKGVTHAFSPGEVVVTATLAATNDTPEFAANATLTVVPAPPQITGYRTGGVGLWAVNVTFLDHIASTSNGFYDGGWNVAFATVFSQAAQGGIGQAPFGQGTVIGLPSQHYVYLTDGLWGTTYLRGPGGPAGALAATHGNGVETTASGSLGQEVLALRFNIGFSNPPAGSTVAAGYYLPAGFGDLRLKGTGTALDGSTLRQVLAAADEALGGGALPGGLTYATLNDLLHELNGSFAGGESSGWANGHLE